ncbi:MAG: hypothetical protein V4524_02470 [Patescibacteria group bacterium]
MQNIKNKTNQQWYLEWFGVALFFAVSLAVYYLVKTYLVGAPQIIGATLCVISAFLSGLIFIVRTLGIIMLIASPEKVAYDIRFDEKNIQIFAKGGGVKVYPWYMVDRIILGEDFDGIYIDATDGKESYDLPMPYRTIENKLDEAIAKGCLSFKKEKQWIDSNQEGLDKHKDATGVKRNYFTRRSLNYARWVNNIVESGNGIETVSYSKIDTAVDQFK